MRLLSNGYQLPEICYGTDIVSEYMFTHNRAACLARTVVKKVLRKESRVLKKEKGIYKCVKSSMRYNCNFYDTSSAYGGAEIMLNKALKGYRRDEFFICTKLCNKDQLDGRPARQCLYDSMTKLGVDYVDLYLLHWPVQGKYLDYWSQLEDLYKEGLIRAIGVSNCKIHHLEEIRKNSRIVPMVDEVELHPLLSEPELREYCKNNGIQLMAYSSTARLDFRLKASRRLENVCKHSGKNMSQVILRWHIQNGVIPIFNTSSIEHLISDLDIFDFELSPEDMKIIEGLNINSRTRYDSDNCEWDRL